MIMLAFQNAEASGNAANLRSLKTHAPYGMGNVRLAAPETGPCFREFLYIYYYVTLL